MILVYEEMDSLSGNQVKDLKDLYKSIYKVEESTEEAVGTPSSVEEENLLTELPKMGTLLPSQIKDEDKNKIDFSTNIAGTSIDKNLNKNTVDKNKNKVKPKMSNIPVIDGPVNNPNFGKKPEVNKVDTNKVNTNKNDLNLKDMEKYSNPNRKEITMKDFESKPNEVKPKVSPATFKTNQNQSRDLVKTGKLKDTDLNKYSRSSTYTADDGKTQVNRSTVNTIAKFDMGPNIKKGDKLGVISGNMRKKYDMKASSFKPEAYDLVLDYVLSEGHADTVEEAHYVMTQMDAETIQTIVEVLGGRPDDGFLGHPNLNIKNPFFRGKRIKEPVLNKSNADKLPDVNVNKVGATIGDRNMKLKKMIDDI